MRGVRNLGEIQGSNFSSIAGFGLNEMDALSEPCNYTELLKAIAAAFAGGTPQDALDWFSPCDYSLL